MDMRSIEYIILRCIRRFLVPGWVLRAAGKKIPFYQPTRGLTTPEVIVDNYWRIFKWLGIVTTGKSLLEVGSGATCGTLYEMVARGAGEVIGIEPYVPFDGIRDRKQLSVIGTRFPEMTPKEMSCVVRREATLANVNDASIDAVVSNSVLEHVRDLAVLFTSLFRVLKSGGCMIHCVDYRDHFFKFPYHFLLFGETVWNNFLAPPDLFRYRCADHVGAMERAGFCVRRMDEKQDLYEFGRVRERVHPSFSGYSERDLSTVYAVLIGYKQNG